MNQGIRNIISQDWITFTILGCLLLIALVKYQYPKKFEDFILIISSDKFLSNSIQNNSLSHPFNSVFIFVQWVVISLFIYMGYCFYTDKSIGQEFIDYLYIMGGYVIFEQAKLGVERLIGHLMQFNVLIKTYTYRKMVLKNFLSLLVLFFCILLAYRSETLKEYYVLFSGILLLIYLISFLFTLRKFQSQILKQPSYFILYFCTLELSPYYIIYKVFI